VHSLNIVHSDSLTSDLSCNFMIWHSCSQLVFSVWNFPFPNSLMILWKEFFLSLIQLQSFTIHAVRISQAKIWFVYPIPCCMTFFLYSMQTMETSSISNENHFFEF
jgi:hypothetical protein